MKNPHILKQSVANLAGVGSHTVSRLHKLGIRIIQDLIFYLPFRYEDKTSIHPIGSLTVGMTALICGKVDITDIMPKGRKSLVCRISDGTGFIYLKFFHYTANQFNSLKAGTWLSCFAEVRQGYAGFEMVHPEYRIIADYDSYIPESHLTPVYSLTEGLSQATIRKVVKEALKDAELLEDWIPAHFLQQYQFPSLL